MASTSSASLYSNQRRPVSARQSHKRALSKSWTVSPSTVSLLPLPFEPCSQLTVTSVLSSFVAEPDEEATAVLALPADVLGSFVVGTVRHRIGEFEPSSGRLILFDLVPSIGGGRELKKLAEAEANGCIYALASVGNAVAVAVNTSVCHSCTFIRSYSKADYVRRLTCT